MVLSTGFVHSLLGFRLGQIRERAQSISNIPPGINAHANSCYYTTRCLVTTLTCPEEVTDCKTTDSFCFLILDLSWAAWTNICSSYLKTQICKATMCLKWQSYTNFLFFTEHFYSSSTDSNLVRSAKPWQIEIPAQKKRSCFNFKPNIGKVMLVRRQQQFELKGEWLWLPREHTARGLC